MFDVSSPIVALAFVATLVVGGFIEKLLDARAAGADSHPRKRGIRGRSK